MDEEEFALVKALTLSLSNEGRAIFWCCCAEMGFILIGGD